MKRIVGMLVLLVVIVFASYFITGLVTENTLKKNLGTFNQTSLLSVELTEYHRGLLSSDAQLTWHMKTPEKIVQQEDGRSLIIPPKSYVFDMPLTIWHGPVIFQKGHVRLRLAMADGELVLPEDYLKEFQEHFTSNSTQPRLMLHALVTYVNKTKLELELPGFKLFSKEAENTSHIKQVKWLGMHSTVVFTPRHTRMQGEINVDGLQMAGEQLQLMFEKLTSSYDMYQNKHGLYLGEASLHIPVLNFTNQDVATLQLKQVDFSSNSDVEHERFASNMHVAFESLVIDQKKYGPAELNLSVQNLDAEVLANLNNQAHQLQQAGMNRAGAQQALLSLLPEVLKLLSQGAIFEISQFEFGLPDGMIHASLRLAFPETKADATLQLLSSIDGAGQFTIPAAYVKSLFVRSYKKKLHKALQHADAPVITDITEPVNLDQQAVQQAAQKMADLIQAGALQSKERDYVLDLKLSDGRLLVNGHPFHSGMLNF